jgi:hypothetical protein
MTLKKPHNHWSCVSPKTSISGSFYQLVLMQLRPIRLQLDPEAATACNWVSPWKTRAERGRQGGICPPPELETDIRAPTPDTKSSNLPVIPSPSSLAGIRMSGPNNPVWRAGLLIQVQSERWHFPGRGACEKTPYGRFRPRQAPWNVI